MKRVVSCVAVIMLASCAAHQKIAVASNENCKIINNLYKCPDHIEILSVQ